ncbi:MAG: S-adenosyl-L-methionine-dependent methyltransferase [Monoraphidium minutum]|nr:MAG: S-adenosyl-L-methionine-dependent methyltransferase [Monoraphidium minutum]
MVVDAEVVTPPAATKEVGGGPPAAAAAVAGGGRAAPDMGRPNANEDHLAPLLRDKLMPLRSRWLAAAPGARAGLRRALEHPRLGTPGVCNFVDARTKLRMQATDARTKWLDGEWLDGEVAAALKAGITQVVVVAAGFDTRSYRFGAEAAAKGQAVSFFEVDLPAASKRKQELVSELFPAAAHPRPAYIAADLAAVPLMDALEGCGFDASKPALFTIEGLIYYLPDSAVARLFGGVLARAAPGSRVAFDSLSRDVLEGARQAPAYKVTARSVANKGEPFISGLPDAPASMQAFFDGPAAGAAAADAPGGAPARRLKLLEFADAQSMAARQLPHLAWPEAGAAAPPPMLSFYCFATAEVVAA